MVTTHWIDVQILVPKSMLLAIIYVIYRVGVSRRLDRALFELLKVMDNGIISHLLNVLVKMALMSLQQLPF